MKYKFESRQYSLFGVINYFYQKGINPVDPYFDYALTISRKILNGLPIGSIDYNEKDGINNVSKMLLNAIDLFFKGQFHIDIRTLELTGDIINPNSPNFNFYIRTNTFLNEKSFLKWAYHSSLDEEYIDKAISLHRHFSNYRITINEITEY